MYNNPYISAYNPQTTADRIDNQIAQLQQMKEQLPQQTPQPTNLTQNFQLAPNSQNGIKYVETIEDVNKEIVFTDTPFFSKDMSVVWIKNAKNEIKIYSLEEIIQKDERDIQIEYLMNEIEELKKGKNKNEKYGSNNGNEPIKEPKSSSISNSSKSK